jgi:hypothetical protein
VIDELTEGIDDGRYIRLERGWAVPSRWSGPLVVFKSLDDRFGVLTRSKINLWRCYLGKLESGGMHGVAWWEEYVDIVVEDFEEGVGKIEAYLSGLID